MTQCSVVFQHGTIWSLIRLVAMEIAPYRFLPKRSLCPRDCLVLDFSCKSGGVIGQHAISPHALGVNAGTQADYWSLQKETISSYPVKTASLPHPGQSGSRASNSSRKEASKASKQSRRPANDRPCPSTSLIASFACNMPMIPGITPRTPASLQFGASAADGGRVNRQR